MGVNCYLERIHNKVLNILEQINFLEEARKKMSIKENMCDITVV